MCMASTVHNTNVAPNSAKCSQARTIIVLEMRYKNTANMNFKMTLTLSVTITSFSDNLQESAERQEPKINTY